MSHQCCRYRVLIFAMVMAISAVSGRPSAAVDAEVQSGNVAVLLADSVEEGKDVPAGWRQGAPVEGLTYSWVEGDASDGNRSVSLQKSTNQYFPIAEWSRVVPHRGAAEYLEVSVKAKAVDAAKAIVDVAFLGDGGRPRGHQWVAYIGVREEGDLPADHEWAQYSSVVRIPPGTVALAFGLQMYGHGSVWFDELAARYVDAADSTLSSPVPSETPANHSAESSGKSAAGAEGEIELDVKSGASGKYLLVPPAAEPSGLVVVLPGGDGSADFHPFVKSIAENALSGKYAVAQPLATMWRPNQQITWPTLRNRAAGMKYATEELVGKVIDDVSQRHQIDRQKIYLLAWSSGGPAAYAIALHPQSPVSGSLIAMSVFKPNGQPSPKRLASRSFYLLHSPEDQVCPYWMAQQAEVALKEAGARVMLTNYDGGHGWQGDVFRSVRSGLEWLEAGTAAAKVK